MSKAGLEMLTKSASLELARFGVRVNCVSASFVNTNLYRLAGLSEMDNTSIKNKEIDTNPTGKVCTVEEVSQVIIHLTSQHSKKITGQIVNVDGGKSLTTRGQHTWLGLMDNQMKGLEVGETSGIVDFARGKYTKALGSAKRNG